jgi:hypothetical protein
MRGATQPRHRIIVGASVLTTQREGVTHEVLVRSEDDAEQAVLAAVRGESVTAYVE